MKSLIALFAMTASITNASEYCAQSPVEALKRLSNAYKSRNIDKSLNAIDFNAWAKSASNIGGVKITPHELKEEYKKNLENGGFPIYTGLSCKLNQKQNGSAVVVYEACSFETGGTYKTNYTAIKSKCGWKIGSLYMPNKALK